MTLLRETVLYILRSYATIWVVVALWCISALWIVAIMRAYSG